MSRRGKITILLIFLLLAGGLMLMFRAAPLPLQSQSFTLSDGSTMTLFKMTYGMNHEITYGTGWHEHIAPFIPARYRTNFGLATAVFVPPANLLSSRDNVVIWLRRSGKIPTTPVVTNPRLTVMVVDDNGLQANTSVQYWNGTLMACLLPSYPRRSAIIHVRVFDAGTGWFPTSAGPMLASLAVPNPAVSTVPPLTADPLPAVWKSNDFEITLKKLETGHMGVLASRTSSSVSSGMGSAPVMITLIAPGSLVPSTYSTAYFDFRDRGQPANNWEVLNLVVSSPTAAPRLQPTDASFAEMQIVQRMPSVATSQLNFTGSSGYNGQGYFFNFNEVLWPEEPVWQVTAQIARTSNFSSNEMWTIRGIPVPHPSAPTSLMAVTNSFGANVIVHALALVGDASVPTLRARVSVSSVSARLVLFRVANDLGEKVNCQVAPVNPATATQGAPQLSGPISWYFDCPYEPWSRSKTIDLTFALGKSYLATFRVKPTLVN